MRFFEDKQLFYLWKPAGIASSRGKESCVLDLMTQGKSLDADIPKLVQEYLVQQGIQECKASEETQKRLLGQFGREEEFGLLNRLDTVTSGFLYFAPDKETYASYRGWQSTGKVQKYYLVRVHGEVQQLLERKKEIPYVSYGEHEVILTYPLAHHKYLDQQMISLVDPALQESTLSKKGRGDWQYVSTYMTILSYNAKDNTTLLRIEIQQGVRHQIRAHLATAGYPIVGERLYSKSDVGDGLQLWSVGAKVLL